jgi:hypothetical protein
MPFLNRLIESRCSRSPGRRPRLNVCTSQRRSTLPSRRRQGGHCGSTHRWIRRGCSVSFRQQLGYLRRASASCSRPGGPVAAPARSAGFRLLQPATQSKAVRLGSAVPVRQPTPAVHRFGERASVVESVHGCTGRRCCRGGICREHESRGTNNGKHGGPHELFSYRCLEGHQLMTTRVPTGTRP